MILDQPGTRAICIMLLSLMSLLSDIISALLCMPSPGAERPESAKFTRMMASFQFTGKKYLCQKMSWQKKYPQFGFARFEPGAA